MAAEGQMPLRFARQEAHVLEARLAGMVVYARTRGTAAAAAHTIQSMGIDCEPEGAEVRIPVRHLPKLLSRPEEVELVPEGPLRTLVEIILRPPLDGAPVLVTVDSPSTLNLSWPGENFEMNEPFPAASAAALLAAGIPVVAHPEAWGRLSGAGHIPLPLGHARVNREHFIEITTPAPHRLLETSLPALFQAGEATYGMPLAFADRIRKMDGILWSGEMPAPAALPGRSGDLPYHLSEHAQEELQMLAGSVGNSFGQAVSWSSGLGRRMFALAAVDLLDSWPCTILCFSEQIWPWHRLAGLVGRTIAMSNARQEIHLRIYGSEALASGDSPTALIFDQFDEILDRNRSAIGSAALYDTLLDPYRIVLSRAVPADPEDLKTMMSLVRPAEFLRDVPVQMLYPEQTQRRLAEHAGCYLSNRSTSDTPVSGFPSSGVIPVRPSTQLARTLDEIMRERREPSAKVAEAMGAISHGTGSSLSPKISVAGERIQEAARGSHTLAVVSNSSRTLELISDMSGEAILRAEGRVKLVEAGRKDPANLRATNRVLYVDYPPSFSYLERMVGRLGEAGCPRSVDVIHMVGTIDDRIARICAVRNEAESVIDPDRPYSDSEFTELAGGV